MKRQSLPHLSTEQVSQVPRYLSRLGVALGPRLGVDFLPVHRHLKSALATPHEGDSLQVIPKLLYKFFRHTDGARSVVSFLAVQYLGFHLMCLLVLLPTLYRSLPYHLAGAMPAPNCPADLRECPPQGRFLLTTTRPTRPLCPGINPAELPTYLLPPPGIWYDSRKHPDAACFKVGVLRHTRVDAGNIVPA